jgi:hypothetical protein
MESEFDMLGVARNPMKYVVLTHLKEKNEKKNFLSQGAQTTNN